MTHRIMLPSYMVYLEDVHALKQHINQGFSKTVIVADENTIVHCSPLFMEWVQQVIPIIVIPAGEEYKTLNTASFIWEKMMTAGMDRHSLMINLGGGVIGDLGGWAASAYMRGIRFIQIPTTLLSMVDSSIGGKLGIDFYGYKNLIGAIQDPLAVFVFTRFLKTLSQDQIKSGFAEMLKHGLICDAPHFKDLTEGSWFDSAIQLHNIYRSIEIKKEVVTADPYEKNVRKILNFGHTIGHAIERYYLTTGSPLLHGEAIATGMVVETMISQRLGRLSQKECDAIIHALVTIYGNHPEHIPPMGVLMEGMQMDKKNKGGKVCFSLLQSIGQAVYDVEVPEEIIKDATRTYMSL